MARKITRDAVAAFLDGYRTFHNGNTEVRKGMPYTSFGVSMYLHGRCIAHQDTVRGAPLLISSGNYRGPKGETGTLTTKERLNGLPGVSVHQKDFQWYLNGELWDGMWTEVPGAERA